MVFLVPILEIKLYLHIFTVAGEDFQQVLTVTLPAGVSDGHTVEVSLTILSDDVVEGEHNFTVAVADTPLVTPGQSTTIVIADSDGTRISNLRC